MASPQFNTIPTELVEHAEVAYEHFKMHGYQIKIEPFEPFYPFRPALVCKSNHTQLVILTCGRIEMAVLETWVSIAKSVHTDFRIAICLPEQSTKRSLPKHHLKIQELGVGIYVSSNGALTSLSDPRDQNIRVALPELKSLSKKTRRILRPAYEHFSGGRWRDCFEAACKSFEQEVRPYFAKAISTGRLTIFHNGAIKNPTKDRINKMTLGQLAVELGKAQPQNLTDSLIHKALEQINPDRVRLTHKNNRASTETNLRKNVGVHMHTIIQAIQNMG